MTTVLTAREPEDLLAAVPVVLGFHPEESLVMLTFGGGRTFHGRIDLPEPGDGPALAATVDALLSPSRAHGVDRVAFVVYSGDPGVAADLAAALVPAFVADGIGVIDVLRAHEGSWCSVPVRADAVEGPPRPYLTSAHPFAAQAVFAGRVTHGSRDDVRRTLARDHDVHRRWCELMAGAGEPGPEGEARARARMAGWVARGAAPDDEGAVEVLRAVTRVEVRDALLSTVSRDTARDHLQVWSALLRGAPDAQVPDTAALTAFCAWQVGDGALAWCALDRCFEVEPRHRLGLCLAECLIRAVPPTTWEEVGREDLTRCGE